MIPPQPQLGHRMSCHQSPDGRQSIPTRHRHEHRRIPIRHQPLHRPRLQRVNGAHRPLAEGPRHHVQGVPTVAQKETQRELLPRVHRVVFCQVERQASASWPLSETLRTLFSHRESPDSEPDGRDCSYRSEQKLQHRANQHQRPGPGKQRQAKSCTAGNPGPVSDTICGSA